MNELKRYIQQAKQEEKEIKTILKIETVMIIIVSIIAVILSFYTIKQSLEIIEVNKENASLRKCIEYKQSVITDLEENLKRNVVEYNGD